MNKRTLALDVGERRIGVAVSDLLDLTAQGVETIFTHGAQNDAARVLELCRQYETDHILVGLPRSMDGTEGYQAARVREFARLLEESGMQIRFWDERLTTVSATRTLLEADVSRSKRRQVVDKLAACYILQSFLDSGGWKPEIHEKENSEKREVFHMSEHNNELDMERDNIVELVDEDGNEVDFEHLMTLEHEGKQYVLLVPIEPMDDVGEDEVVILQIDTDEAGNDIYATVEDDEILDDVFEKYLEIVEDDED